MGGVFLIIYGKTYRNKGKLTQFVIVGLQKVLEVTEHHFPVLFYFTFPNSRQFRSHPTSLSWSSLHMRCGCSFFLQHWAKTQHLIGYLRQEEEDWHGLVEFSFPGAYWKHARCCFSEHCRTLRNFVCICGSKDFARSTLPQNDSPALALTAVSFICFSFSLSVVQTCKSERNCPKPAWVPFQMQQRAPVFQLEAAAVAALSHHKVWVFPTTILKKTVQFRQTCNAFMEMTKKHFLQLYNNYTMAKGFCIC